MRAITRTEDIAMVTRRFALILCASVVMPFTADAGPRPLVTVHKDPTCGCCGGWVAHLQVNGFDAKVIETTKLNPLKAKLGVPIDLAACHTAEVEGYVVEGHVPASAIKRLLAERPKARGLAVPGMPQGSPGMTGEYEKYDVIVFGPDERRVYATFKGDKEVEG
jgi:hypothetical protein